MKTIKKNSILTFVVWLAVGCSVFAQERDTAFVYEFDLNDLNKKESGMVSIGTRTAGYSIEESLVPVDIITAEELRSVGQVELSQALTYLVASFNANHQTISDGTDHIVPASLRGLGPDQMLVFINGKRRHASSLVNVNGTFGRGTVSTDFDAIPIAAIKQIEILRDGASAQYGSDAIAGVVNIVLHEKIGAEASALYSKTTVGDGERFRLDANYGVKVGTKGFINVTAEFVARAKTNRSGEYSGTIYHYDEDEDLADPRTALFDRQTMNIGNAQAHTGKLYYNLSIPLRQRAEFYSFGGISFRQGMATGFYRFPKEEQKVVRELYPDGFLPEIHAPVQDHAYTIGIRQKYKKWDLDASATYGKNTFDFKVQNSNNASLGKSTPTNFYCGGFAFSELTANFDISRAFHNVMGLQHINTAFGSEFRLDRFAIIAGEETSYIDGKTLTPSGESRLAGAQLFSGFQKQNELDESRFSSSVYADIEATVTSNFAVALAGNFVNYSDWGKNFSGKIALRYKLFPWLYARSSLSSGFRASSLHQSYSTNVSTQIIDGNSVQVGTFNRNSKVTKALGIPELSEEKSLTHTFGIVLKPIENLLIIADYYWLNIYDRIVLSGRFSTGDSDEIRALLEPFGVNSAQFFTNAIDTQTLGGDLEASYSINFGNDLQLNLSASFNLSANKIIGDIKTSEQLAGNEEILFNREERSRIERAQPANKSILDAVVSFQKLAFSVKSVRFGSLSYVHPLDRDRDQEFSPKWLTDFEVSYAFTPKTKFSFGGMNVFDVYPDKLKHEGNTSSGQFIYSRRVTQFGFNGASFYASLKIGL